MINNCSCQKNQLNNTMTINFNAWMVFSCFLFWASAINNMTRLFVENVSVCFSSLLFVDVCILCNNFFRHDLKHFLTPFGCVEFSRENKWFNVSAKHFNCNTFRHVISFISFHLDGHLLITSTYVWAYLSCFVFEKIKNSFNAFKFYVLRWCSFLANQGKIDLCS